MSDEALITITAVGDVCLGDHYFSLGHGTASTFSRTRSLKIDEGLMRIFSCADVAFFNMECPLSHVSDGRSKVEQAVFRGHLDFAPLISEAGFSVAGIANNHICQHGPQAFDDTVAALRAQSVEPIGLAADRGSYCSVVPYIATIRGVSVGILGYSLVPERYMPRQNKYAAPSRQQIIQDAKGLAQKVDVVVVSVHGGEEGVTLPSPDTIIFFREIIEAGATVVLGHHSHVFQPVERWKRGLIVYSLGDFIFDLFWNHLFVESAVVQIDILPGKNFVFKIIPVNLQSDYTVALLHGGGKRSFFERVDKASLLINKLEDAAYEKMFLQQIAELESGQVVLKAGYFLRNFMKGNSLLKTQFVAGKFKKKILHRL